MLSVIIQNNDYFTEAGRLWSVADYKGGGGGAISQIFKS